MSADEIVRRLAVVRRIIGADFLADFERNGIRTLAPVVEIVVQSAILERLELKQGFPTIRKRISSVTAPRFFVPEPEWFQLLIGYVIDSVDADFGFEVRPPAQPDTPKDILVQHGPVHVECKSFVRSRFQGDIDQAHLMLFRSIRLVHDAGDWTVRIERDVNDGDPYADVLEMFSTLDVDRLHHVVDDRKRISASAQAAPRLTGPVGLFVATGASRRLPGAEYMPYSFIAEEHLVIDFHGPRHDQTDRIERALLDKVGQLIPGVANMVAIDVAQFTGDLGGLRTRLEENVFSPEMYGRISGVMLVRYLLEGCCYRLLLDFLRNPHAEVPLPPSWDALPNDLVVE